eukprot:2785936-Amphidinium_carterae.1
MLTACPNLPCGGDPLHTFEGHNWILYGRFWHCVFTDSFLFMHFGMVGKEIETCIQSESMLFALDERAMMNAGKHGRGRMVNGQPHIFRTEGQNAQARRE